ncbi:glycosyltransferase family 4 protein [Jatrophihabitans endophyticus]|uniref:glycosyltransferase family 4 protein n=1 Tax=Jatrophihabitans endophyticus TaxID=1206085 RepID=UPI001A01D995|nr:glycosyltransferase family 4 protein [Jatrophihabitans endophyticus]MBE7187702.1 glycosyltransferase family 4 protein [Jatrophihabitans endophyticus]
MTAVRPLRVLEVSQRYFPDLGGTESHIHEVTTRMAAMPDIEPTVLATDRSRALPRSERSPQGFEIVRRNSYPRSRDYYVSPGIARVIRDGDWDVVHFQGVHTFVPIIGMLAARRARKPYVLTFHTGGHSSSSRSAIRNLQWRLLTPLLRVASRLIAVSRYERGRFEAATGIDASHFTVIRNGGSLPELPRPVTPVPGRVVSSGRLERYKGHHRAIEALPVLRRSVPDAHLVILGGGDYESELRALAVRLGVAEHVQIYQVDPRDRSAMAVELASAQVLAALSDYEAHPVAIMEALTLGTPVVGLDVAGTGDLVEDGLVTGIPVTASADDVAAALATAMAGGRRPVGADVDFPTWDTCAAQLADVYREVAGRAR